MFQAEQDKAELTLSQEEESLWKSAEIYRSVYMGNIRSVVTSLLSGDEALLAKMYPKTIWQYTWLAVKWLIIIWKSVYSN